MCVCFEPARLSNTTLYIGEVQHPKHGLIHVVGYQNQVGNLVDKPNCMILHFPCLSPMTPENAIDCSRMPGILRDMCVALNPDLLSYCCDATDYGAAAAAVHVFDVGAYSVVMSATPEKIPGALCRIPETKRPTLNSEIFRWYQENLPGYSVALCCFEAKVNLVAEPMLWWYQPRDASVLFAPALDAHDGAAPALETEVEVDHFLITSVPEWSLDDSKLCEGSQSTMSTRPEIAQVHYTDEIPESVLPYLPKLVTGASFQGKMKNGDFMIEREGLTPQTFNHKVRRVAPEA